jgi:hypothetical protein
LSLAHDDNPAFLKLETRQASTEMVRKLDWFENTKRKGNKDPTPFIVMFATFMIAIYETKSPLHIQMVQNGLGSPWTTKHGAKAIMPLTLVKLGLAHAETGGILKSPNYGTNWSLLTPLEVKSKYNFVVEKLKPENLPYGAFEVLKDFVGEKRAAELALGKGQCLLPPGLVSLVSEKDVRNQRRWGKRKREPEMDESD